MIPTIKNIDIQLNKPLLNKFGEALIISRRKNRVVFWRFFFVAPSMRTAGLDVPLSLVTMPWREHIRGRGCSSFTRKRSSRFVPIFAHDAWVYRGGGSGAVVQYTPSVLSASCLERRFNQYRNLNHPSALAPAFSASRLVLVSAPRSACLLAMLPRCAGMWAGLRGRDSAHRTPWRDYH